jgi:hypothetical protein
MLDALARIAEPDLKLVWPKEEKMPEPEHTPRIEHNQTAWMA